MGQQLELFGARGPAPQVASAATPPAPPAPPAAEPVEPPAGVTAPSAGELPPSGSSSLQERPARASDALRALRKVECALRDAQREGAQAGVLERLELEHQALRSLHVQLFERLPSQQAVIAALFEALGRAPAADLIAAYNDIRRAFVVRQIQVQ